MTFLLHSAGQQQSIISSAAALSSQAAVQAVSFAHHGKSAVSTTGRLAAGPSVLVSSKRLPGCNITRSNSPSASSRGAAAAEAAWQGQGVATLAERPPSEVVGPAAAGGSSSNSSATLELIGGACVLPHPEKIDKGGEDGFFVAPNRRAVGVADGVGGWADVKIDAGLYAKMLMRMASEEAVKDSEAAGPHSNLDAQSILERAHAKTSLKGSSTACVAVINGRKLQASNLGDSGFLILRGSKVMYLTSQQQHSFNFPYQMASKGANSDQPSAAQRHEVDVQPQDVILMGTDGLWDNCYTEEIVSVLLQCQAAGMRPSKIASVMAHYARFRASDAKFASPFAYSALQAGFSYMGGKMDDITCLVAVVSEPTTAERARL